MSEVRPTSEIEARLIESIARTWTMTDGPKMAIFRWEWCGALAQAKYDTLTGGYLPSDTDVDGRQALQPVFPGEEYAADSFRGQFARWLEARVADPAKHKLVWRFRPEISSLPQIAGLVNTFWGAYARVTIVPIEATIIREDGE